MLFPQWLNPQKTGYPSVPFTTSLFAGTLWGRIDYAALFYVSPKWPGIDLPLLFTRDGIPLRGIVLMKRHSHSPRLGGRNRQKGWEDGNDFSLPHQKEPLFFTCRHEARGSTHSKIAVAVVSLLSQSRID